MDELTLRSALAIDAFTVVICLVIAIKEARTPLHPAWTFLGLHLYIVTFRLVQLYAGAIPLKVGFAWPVSVSEMIRAGVASDIGLLAIAAGWIVARVKLRRSRPAPPKVVVVSKLRILLGAALAMAGGAFGLLTVRRFERGVTNTSWDQTGYLFATTSWPAWSMCLLHFIYGFPILLLIVTLGVFIVVGFTNARFAVIIPMIFLTLLWLSRRRSSKFPFVLVAGILAAFLVWLPMKPFVKMVKGGSGATDSAVEAIRFTYAEFNKEEGSLDQQFLDMVAATMTLSDVHGSWYWGGTILPLFTSPVPRILWPEKPKMNQYQVDLQVPSRNMTDYGMTAGLVAEGYVNFGYAGVVLYCFGVGFAFAWAYWKVARSDRRSASWLLYLFCLASAAQLYRDGLISGVWFPFVYAAPIGFMAISHWIWKPGRLREAPMVKPTVVKSAEYVGQGLQIE